MSDLKVTCVWYYYILFPRWTVPFMIMQCNRKLTTRRLYLLQSHANSEGICHGFLIILDMDDLHQLHATNLHLEFLTQFLFIVTHLLSYLCSDSSCCIHADNKLSVYFRSLPLIIVAYFPPSESKLSIIKNRY